MHYKMILTIIMLLSSFYVLYINENTPINCNKCCNDILLSREYFINEYDPDDFICPNFYFVKCHNLCKC